MDLGLRQRDVAKQLGVKKATYDSWEQGHEPLAGNWPGILSFLCYDPFPKPDTLRERIRWARLRLALGEIQLAERLGVNRCTVTSWKIGSHRPQPRLMERVEALVAEAEAASAALASLSDEPP